VAAGGACAPRPAVRVTSTGASAGRLQVTVAAGTAPGTPSNALVALRFGTATNAAIDAGDQTGQPGGFTVSLPPGTAQTTFTVRRLVVGAATTVNLVVVDGCGEWPTVVGGGAGAF
jgi:hypothetical protein